MQRNEIKKLLISLFLSNEKGFQHLLDLLKSGIKFCKVSIFEQKHFEYSVCEVQKIRQKWKVVFLQTLIRCQSFAIKLSYTLTTNKTFLTGWTVSKQIKNGSPQNDIVSVPGFGFSCNPFPIFQLEWKCGP